VFKDRNRSSSRDAQMDERILPRAAPQIALREHGAWRMSWQLLPYPA
jgi:hypothetical protein